MGWTSSERGRILHRSIEAASVFLFYDARAPTYSPYGIIYFVQDNEVVVVAYAHERRHPGYGRKRLKDL